VGSRRVLILGLAGLAAFSAFFLIRPLFGPDPYGPRPAGTTYAYSFLVVAAFVPYAAAVWAVRRGVSLRVAIAGTILLHGLLLPAALTQSQDLYMYLFYGKMWAVHGANPYLVEPQAFRTDAWFPWVRWPDQPTVYGPLWTMVTAVPAGLASGSLSAAFALAKTVAALLGVASAAGLVAACRGRGEPAGPRLVLLAWNPVILVSLPLGGHADIAVVAGVLWAVVADRRGRPVVATALLTAASLVKAYAALVLLVYLICLARRGKALWASAGAAVGLTVAAFAPFWQGWRTLRGVGEVSAQASASLAGELQRALQGPLGETPSAALVRVGGLVVVVLVIMLHARSPTFREDPWPAAAAAFLAYFLVTPWFLYWHQAGLLALAAAAATVSVRASAYTFSATSMLTASLGGSPWGRGLQAALRYGPPLALLGRRRISSRRVSSTPASR
jgi:hypothetical protein